MKTRSLSIFLKSLLGAAIIGVPLAIVTPIMLSSSKKGELEQHANSFAPKPTLLGKQTLPSNIFSNDTLANYVDGLPTSKDGIDAKIIKIKNQNNESGTLIVHVNFSKESTKFEKEYLIRGFKTRKQQDLDDINDFIDKANINLTPTSLGKQTLPKNITNILNINQYVFGFPQSTNNIQINVKEIKNQDDKTGTLTLSLEFSKGYQKVLKDYDVIGFKTIAQQNINEVNDFINNLNVNLKATKLGSQTLPESITNIDNIDDYVTGFPRSQNNIAIKKITVSEQSNQAGTLNITLEFSRNSYKISKTYTATGFKTTFQQTQDEINDFVNNLNLNLVPTTLGTQTLPSNIKDINTISKYINNLPISANGIEVQMFELSKQNNTLGSLTLKIKYLKNGYYVIKEYLVDGFKTTSQQNQEDLNDFANNLNLNLAPTQLGTTVFPSSITNPSLIDSFVNGIPIGTNGISVTVIDISKQNNEDGSLSLKIEYSKGGQKIERTYLVSGFKTNAMQDQEDVENFIFTNAINLVPTPLGIQTLPTRITDIDTIDQYVSGFPTNDNGVVVTKTIVNNQDDNNGTLNVTLKFSKNNYSTTRNYQVVGFKTIFIQNQNDLNDIMTYLNNINVNLNPTQLGTQTLPEQITDINTITNYLGPIPLGSNGVNVEVVDVLDQRNATGQLKVSIKYSKGSQEQIRTYTVSGFRTSNEQDKIDLDNYVNNLNPNLLPTDLGTKTLPSNIFAVNEINNYVQNIPISENGIKVQIQQIIDQNDDNGSLSIIINYSKNNQSRTKTYPINGFKTTSKQNNDDVDSFINNFNANLIPTPMGAITLPTNITDINTIDQYVTGFPNPTNGVSVRKSNILNKNNNNGSLEITLEFSKGNTKKSKTYLVNGFKTTSKQDEDDVNALANQELNLLPTQLGKETYPTNITDLANITNYIQGIPIPTNGVSVNVERIHQQDDNNGILKLDIKYSKGQTEVTKTYLVNNFKSKAPVIENILELMNNIKLTANNLGASKIPQEINNSEISNYVAGIPNNTGVNVSIKNVVAKDDQTGIIKVLLTFEQDGIIKEKEYDVTGFGKFNLLDFNYEIIKDDPVDIRVKWVRLKRYIGTSSEVYVPKFYKIGGIAYNIVEINNDLIKAGFDWLTKFYMDNRFTDSFAWTNFFENQQKMKEITFSSSQKLGSSMFKNAINNFKLNINWAVNTTIPEDCFNGAVANLDLDNLQYTKITGVGLRAFYKSTINAEKMILPNTITYIDNSAFEETKGLKRFEIASGAGDIWIGGSAFKNTGIQSLRFNKMGRLDIWEYAFENNNFDEYSFDFRSVNNLVFRRQSIFYNTGCAQMYLPRSNNYSSTRNREWTYGIERRCPNNRFTIWMPPGVDSDSMYNKLGVESGKGYRSLFSSGNYR